MTQNLLNGFQTANRTRLAESQVFAARETLRTIEQTVLLNAATAYMNLLRDAGILELQRSNLEVLQEQLRQTKARLESGNVTATDVSQAEARLNVGRTQLFTAEANYASSRAVYRQVIGLDPGRLAPATPVDRFTPQHAARRDGRRHRAKPRRHHRAAQRRRRHPSGQGRRGRALSDLVAARQRAEELRAGAELAAVVHRLGLGAILGAALPGRRRICRDPAGQGDARARSSSISASPATRPA